MIFGKQNEDGIILGVETVRTAVMEPLYHSALGCAHNRLHLAVSIKL